MYHHEDYAAALPSDITPTAVFEDQHGGWWCEFDGEIYKAAGGIFATKWKKAKFQSWPEIEQWRGELWRVPEFTDPEQPKEIAS